MTRAESMPPSTRKVLFITSEPRHRILYEKGLRSHFQVEFSASADSQVGDEDAIVYDIPKRHSPGDIRWLRSASKPVVVLTPEDELPLPKVSNRCVLTYPVSMDGIMQALGELGVRASGEGETR
jgi:hypothetical protein